MPTRTRDPEDYADVLGLIRKALGWDPVPDPTNPEDGPTLEDIPEDARFTLRRDIEYSEWVESHFAAPMGGPYNPETRTYDIGGWDLSTNLYEPDAEPVESEWVGSDQLVYWARWDWYDVDLETLVDVARANNWEPRYAEPLGGYLDAFGVHPAVSMHWDSMDWNIGGWTPVFIGVDYIVLD